MPNDNHNKEKIKLTSVGDACARSEHMRDDDYYSMKKMRDGNLQSQFKKFPDE